VRKSKGLTKPAGEVKANGVSVVFADGGQSADVCNSHVQAWMNASRGFNRVDPA